MEQLVIDEPKVVPHVFGNLIYKENPFNTMEQ